MMQRHRLLTVKSLVCGGLMWFTDCSGKRIVHRKCWVLSVNKLTHARTHTDCCGNMHSPKHGLWSESSSCACKIVHQLEVWLRKTFPLKTLLTKVSRCTSSSSKNNLSSKMMLVPMHSHAKSARNGQCMAVLLQTQQRCTLKAPPVQPRSSTAFSFSHHLRQGGKHSP